MMRSIINSALALLLVLPTVAVATASPDDTEETNVAPESETPIKAEQPLVKKISEDVLSIGKITFNKKSREITFTTQTNIVSPDTPLEYLIVHSNGEKVHESLLITEIDPTNLNIALKLLNYKESLELFRPYTEEGIPGDKYYIVADDVRKAARFTIHVDWKEGDADKSAPITEWIAHRVTTKPMAKTPWVYNGSYIHNQKFAANVSGCIFAIYPNEGSIANYPGTDRDDDTLWVPANGLPREGSNIKITLRPWTGKLTAQKKG